MDSACIKTISAFLPINENSTVKGWKGPAEQCVTGRNRKDGQSAHLVEKCMEEFMNPSERIDEQIAELADWRGQMLARLRQLILEADPDIIEEWKWGTPVWSHQGLVCAVGAFKATLKMNFFQGASLQDAHKLFNAGLDAKKTRSIDFREGDTVDESALKDLIRAAVAHNVG
jgi:hypothetical protein